MSKVLPQPTRADRLRAIRARVGGGEPARHHQHPRGRHRRRRRWSCSRRCGRRAALNVRVYAALSVTDAMTDGRRRRLRRAPPEVRGEPADQGRRDQGDGRRRHRGAHGRDARARTPTTRRRATPTTRREELQRIVSMMDRRGWQVMTHAIGDGAVRMTLDAYEAAAEANPAPPAGRRHRIEHAETIDPGRHPALRQQNTIVSYMPFHANPTPAQLDVWTTNIGPDRSSRGLDLPHAAAGRRAPGVRQRLARRRARSAPRDQHGGDAPHTPTGCRRRAGCRIRPSASRARSRT